MEEEAARLANLPEGERAAAILETLRAMRSRLLERVRAVLTGNPASLQDVLEEIEKALEE